MESLIQRPLYVFDLPPELLYTLQLKLESSLASSPSPDAQTPLSPSLNATDKQGGSPPRATSCSLCGLEFEGLQEQRSHVRSDLHGYNLKQKLRGKKPVTEAEFERLVGQLDESISGSDSSESGESDEDENDGGRPRETTLSALLKRQAMVSNGDAEDVPAAKKKRDVGKAPLLWFTSPKLQSNTSLGIYRAVFSNQEQSNRNLLVETLQRKQLAQKLPEKQQKSQDEGNEGGVPLPASMLPQVRHSSGPHYFLCMVGGGHFAAMLVSLTPKVTKRSGTEDRAATVIAHKTFHRYTTRRKQGGSQSANDNAKGNAHSAGSSIRRHNEVALTEEIRRLLADWKPLINSAELLFIRASGTTNRRTLFGPYEDQVLHTRDERIRGFPFNTRRATQSELMRAFVELTRVKINVVDEAALAREAEEAAAAAKAKTEAANLSKPSTPKPSKPTKADEEAAMHTTQLQALIRRSKAPALLSYLQSNKIPPDFPFFPADQNHHAPNPLHLAAASNSPVCITALLMRSGADPTILNADAKAAFDLAGDRATRDAFRLARSELGEDRWDWDAAQVPAALSHTEVESRSAAEKKEKAAEVDAEKARRAAEVERLRKEDEEKKDGAREAKMGKGRLLERPVMTAEERRQEEARGLTEEGKKRLEREKRARAAEERMKKLVGGH